MCIRDRYQRRVRVITACINAKIAHLLTAKRTLRDHTLNRFLNHTLRETTTEDLACSCRLNTTRVTCVTVVNLVSHFPAGQLHFFSVDNNHVVTAIHVRSVRGLVLPTENNSDGLSQTTKNYVLCVNDQPFLFDLRRFCGIRFHRNYASVTAFGFCEPQASVKTKRMRQNRRRHHIPVLCVDTCLLYTSDAADDLLCVDLGGRRIIKKKKKKKNNAR
eukprot:TRINITY_DN1147_c0_g2_i6.p1 TRINITY_DN1147_c0_g2~~TRINITY_DN1147_c0_g2_i6.p1  ORF type:complete len:217 (+),score=41.89 TRINITY_DN1147_c0_g2_i6:158-808(+)